MLNAEKFKDEILETLDCDCEGFGVTEDNKITMCRADSFCCICSFLKDGFCNREAKDRWLLSEYKEPIKLTRLEYLLLKLFYKKDFRYLTRSAEGYLFINKGNNPPLKKCGMWFNRNHHITFEVINDLFPFIKWEDEEPRAIKDILDNCEVVDYD